MIKKLAAAGLFAAALTSLPALSYAGDFPAAPLNPGPPVLPGQHVLPGADIAVGIVNGVTQPILQPILVPGGEAASVAPAPLRRHHHLRRHSASWKVKHKVA